MFTDPNLISRQIRFLQDFIVCILGMGEKPSPYIFRQVSIHLKRMPEKVREFVQSVIRLSVGGSIMY